MRITEEDDQGKRDPRDFALWKRARPGDPVWPAPWGEGRPGWHIECSAMARKYLGTEFDIHGGGANLIFPHHENEMAQSRAAGDSFARFWMHNGQVTHRGEKIRKHVRNPLAVSTLLNRIRPVELRYYLASAHYRSTMEFSVEAVEEAATAFRRVERFVLRLGSTPCAGSDAIPDATSDAISGTRDTHSGERPRCRPGGTGHGNGWATTELPEQLPEQFTEAMDNDLNVAQALATVHRAVGDGHAALSSGDREGAARKSRSVRGMLNVLGLDPLSETWSRETHLQEVAGAVLRVVRDLAATALSDGKHERARTMQRQIELALKKRRSTRILR